MGMGFRNKQHWENVIWIPLRDPLPNTLKVTYRCSVKIFVFSLTGIGHLNGIHIGLEFQDADPSSGKECLVCQLRKSLETSIIYKEAQQRVERQRNTLCGCWGKLVAKQPSEHKCCEIDVQPSSCHLCDFTLAHFLAMIILSWPYDVDKRNKHGEDGALDVHSSMNLIVFTELSNLDKVLEAEVENTKKRFSEQINK